MFVFYGFGFIAVLLVPAHLLITLPIIGFVYFTGGEINDKLLSIAGGIASFCAITAGLIGMVSIAKSGVIDDSLQSKIKGTRAVILFIKRLRNIRIPRLEAPTLKIPIENLTCWCGHLEKSHVKIKTSDLLDSLYGCHTCYSEKKIWRRYVWHSFSHRVSRSTAMAMINTKLDPAVDSVPDEIPAEIRRRYLGFLMFVGIIILLGLSAASIGEWGIKAIGVIVAVIGVVAFFIAMSEKKLKEFFDGVGKIITAAIVIGLIVGFSLLMANSTGEEGDYCPRCAPTVIYQEEMLSQ